MAKKTRTTPLETRLYEAQQPGKKARYIEATSKNDAHVYVTRNAVKVSVAKLVKVIAFRDAGGVIEKTTAALGGSAPPEQTDIEGQTGAASP